MKKRHCKHCGAAIPTFGYSPSNYEKLQYCSNLCAHRAKGKGKGTPAAAGWKPKGPFTCKNCGREFFKASPSGRTMYCSGECAAQAKKKQDQDRAKSSPVEPRICAMCGKVFTPLSKNRGQKCCSTACGVKYRQIYGSYHSTFRPDLPDLTWNDVFERVKKFHPELSKKIGLDSTEKQVEIIRRFDAEKRERKEDLYAWFYNRYICPDSRMCKLVIARTELAEKITKGELK